MKTERTKVETGTEQNDGVKPSREPSISYDSNGRRVKANDIGLERTDREADAINDAIREATGNRRDDPPKEIH